MHNVLCYMICAALESTTTYGTTHSIAGNQIQNKVSP